MPTRTARIQTRISTGKAPLLSTLRVVAVLSAMFLVWSTLRLEPWTTSPTRTNAAESTTPWTEVNPLGVNTFLSREVEPWKRERTLDMASEAGVGWIKEHFPWRDIETAPDTYWDSNFQQDAWAKFDAIVDDAEKHGLRIIARIDLAPQWARPTGSGSTAPPTNVSDFADFVASFVERYQGRVQFIQIWNEPNLAREWGGEIDPAGYAELLRAAATAARDADPNVVILSAPLAMTTENSDRAMDDLSYWQALYDAGAAPYFDIMSANAYGLDQPYDAAPNETELNIRRIELLRDLALQNGDQKPIWLNEYGWNASPEDFPPDQLTWSRVSEIQQAEWTTRGIDYLRSEHDWFGVANVWYFRQVGDIGTDRSDYYFRAVDVEFTPRPLYRELKRFGEVMRYARPGTHNDLSAAVRTSGTWKIIRSTDALNGEYIAGETGAGLQIQIEGNKLVAILASGQPATAIEVSASGKDDTRKIAIGDGQKRVTLATWSADQAAQKRTISIDVVGSGPLLLDGIDVTQHRSARTLYISGIVLVLSLVGYVLLRREVAR